MGRNVRFRPTLFHPVFQFLFQHSRPITTPYLYNPPFRRYNHVMRNTFDTIMSVYSHCTLHIIQVDSCTKQYQLFLHGTTKYKTQRCRFIRHLWVLLNFQFINCSPDAIYAPSLPYATSRCRAKPSIQLPTSRGSPVSSWNQSRFALHYRSLRSGTTSAPPA